MSFVSRLFCGLTFFVLLVTLVGCKPEPIDPPSSDSITKADRALLGERLLERIKNRPIDYPILANIDEDTLVYQFVQTLYNQATASIRIDLNSPISNRWNQDRDWDIYILNRDNIIDAFTLPGGDLFITTGFLKSMEREHELFYLLSLEANLINEKYLLNRMVLEYNTLNLHSIIDGAVESNGIGVEEILKDVTEFVFNENELNQIDKVTVPSICNTSVYSGDGIAAIIDRNIGNANYWLQTRMSYGGRENVVTELATEGNCGSLRTTGAYQEFILDVLD